MFRHYRSEHGDFPGGFALGDFFVITGRETGPYQRKETAMADEVIEEKVVTKEVETPLDPVERTTETTYVPSHEATREEHRVSGEPEHVVTETVTEKL